jgi:ABC-type glutathione transport system ATPase component
VVLHAGTVAEYGPVEQILTRPADPYTMRLIEDVPKLARPGQPDGSAADRSAD